MLKREIRIIAWDDAGFKKNSAEVLLVGAIFRGAEFMDGMLSAKIIKDGMDATEKISGAITKSRHYDQLSVIMTDGITFGGFNILDIKRLHESTGLPVIAIQRRQPDMKKFLSALYAFEDSAVRKQIVEKAGKFRKFKKIYYQAAGIENKQCENILALTCIRSDIPEPLRVAHLIASGLSGESRGRA
ncbi:MAG: DUF99 family protein [Candidatus Aenigmarchaeota archaeon]|nr:DUF99 family protein [Candidatus Aenigmarchaeota archaeon]